MNEAVTALRSLSTGLCREVALLVASRQTPRTAERVPSRGLPDQRIPQHQHSRKLREWPGLPDQRIPDPEDPQVHLPGRCNSWRFHGDATPGIRPGRTPPPLVKPLRNLAINSPSWTPPRARVRPARPGAEICRDPGAGGGGRGGVPHAIPSGGTAGTPRRLRGFPGPSTLPSACDTSWGTPAASWATHGGQMAADPAGPPGRRGTRGGVMMAYCVWGPRFGLRAGLVVLPAEDPLRGASLGDRTMQAATVRGPEGVAGRTPRTRRST